MHKIKKIVLQSICIAAQRVYPNEFISMLGKNEKEEVFELVMLPAVYGRNFSSIRTDLIPFDKNIVGTIHSHPSKNNNPSSADLNVFSRLGKIHLIICWPFNLEDIKAFNEQGKKIELEVVK
ncbi:Mov34/MPN/PAD-1 family protein [Candidatus Micrarchaeota archaeon]|nr:Mov34/MPN/PAD-1 family protein [Candidatus Micrarchaeota archaeon]MBU2477338.1 Mov34/MPN/PAD-1 family protein [Candidatus Micrarchaeota archaeon]